MGRQSVVVNEIYDVLNILKLLEYILILTLLNKKHNPDKKCVCCQIS